MLYFIFQEDKSFLKNRDLSVRATMAVKLRLGEKEILEKAVKSAAVNREYYRRQMEAKALLPKYEESSPGPLEMGAAGARLPLVLRNLEEEAGGQEALSLSEAVSRAKAVENGLVNGENSIPNGARSGKENVNQEESKRATEDAKGSSSDSTGDVKG